MIEEGYTIVSGLAMGVDALAAIIAVVKTIAVFGSGVDLCIPAENINFYYKIFENGGAIVLESPLGRMLNKGVFSQKSDHCKIIMRCFGD